MNHNFFYNIFNSAYGDTDIIYDSALVCLMLIILRFIYHFLKKKYKLSNFHCFLLTIISILPLYFLLKVMIYLLIISVSIFNWLFTISLENGFYYHSSLSLKKSKLLSHIIMLFSSSVCLFFILKFYNKNYFKQDKIFKFFIILSIISSSLIFINHYKKLIFIVSDYILTHLIDLKKENI